MMNKKPMGAKMPGMKKEPMVKTPGFLTSKPAPTAKTPAVKAPKMGDMMKMPTGMIPKPKPAAMPKAKPAMPSMGMPMKKGKK